MIETMIVHWWNGSACAERPKFSKNCHNYLTFSIQYHVSAADGATNHMMFGRERLDGRMESPHNRTNAVVLQTLRSSDRAMIRRALISCYREPVQDDDLKRIDYNRNILVRCI